jgi:asparagine synthetase B (glutamine-hydrolysing)
LDHLSINEKYIAKELKNYPVEVGETFFNEIHRLKPAHYFSASAKDLSFTEKRYWHFIEMDTRPFKTPQAVYDELRRLFYQAVECRLKGVSIAATQLSGGMDSSAITVIASRLMPKENLHTFSFVLNEKTRAFSERGVDEQATQNSILEYAQLHQENHHLSDGFYYKDTFECYDQSNQIMGGVANSDAVWQDSMFKQAAEQGVELMFSGFPGDEGISNPGGRYFFEYFHQMDFAWMFKQLISQPYIFAKQVYRYLSARFSKVTLKGYDKVQKNRNLLNPDSPFHSELKDSSFGFNSSFRQELINKTFRAHSCLRTESEGLYASQYGIVTAYPMADLRFVQFALSLPMEYFNPKEFSRPLFRKICEGILPDDVRLQKKQNGAMTLAFAEFWKKEQLKDFATWSIRNSLGLFDMNKVFTADDFDLLNRKVERNKIDYLVEKNRVNHGK